MTSMDALAATAGARRRALLPGEALTMANELEISEEERRFIGWTPLLFKERFLTKLRDGPIGGSFEWAVD